MILPLYALVILLVESKGATIDLDWDRNVGNQGTTSIVVGDSVRWTLTDDRQHTVTSSDGGFASSGNIQGSGTTYTVTFQSVGSFSYLCDIHNMMRGVISVAGTPTSSPTAIPSANPTTGAPSTAQPTGLVTVAPTISLSPTVAPSEQPSTATPTAPTLYPTASPTSEVYEYERLRYPDVISSGSSVSTSWNATIEVRAHRHSNSRVSFNTRSYCYNGKCSYPGPTISLKPGDVFNLTLKNSLEEDLSTSHAHNTIHSPNVTNVHTHGLHVSPKVDNVFLKAEPGESLVYVYEIPTTHAPGLHWYHAHHHGSSALQIMNGLVGALIIEDIVDGISDLPISLKESDEHTLVMTRLIFEQETIRGEVSQGCGSNFACDPDSQGPLCTGNEVISPWNLFRDYTIGELSAEADSTLSINEEFEGGWSERNFIFINGQFRPTIELNESSPSILRIVHAHGSGPFLLSILNDPQEVCSFTVLAWDGVYLDSRLNVRNNETLNIVAAGRVDVEVVCTASGLYKLANQLETILWLRVNDTTSTARLSVSSSDLASLVRPWYLSDLRGVSASDINSTYSVAITQENFNPNLCQFWLGVGNNCGNISPHGANVLPNTTDDVNCPFSVFGGEQGEFPAQYLAANKLVTYTGAINEWKLYGLGSAFHPLHVHVNHMQIISSSSAGPDGVDLFYRPGQWRDTIPPVADEVTFRFVAADFTGETVLHCHFQRHEDLGMMDTFLVVNETEYSTYFAPTLYPTKTPTENPTAYPSIKPTRYPTMFPTGAPSFATETILLFNITIKVDGLNSTQFIANQNISYAYIAAIARASNISTSEIRIITVLDTFIPSVVGRSQNLRRGGTYPSQRSLGSYHNVYVKTLLNIMVEDKGYESSNAEALYEAIGRTVNDSVTLGKFSSLLADAAAEYVVEILLDVDTSFYPVIEEATVITERTLAPTATPSTDTSPKPKDEELSIIFITIIVIAAIFICTTIGVIAFRQRVPSKCNIKVSPREAESKGKNKAAVKSSDIDSGDSRNERFSTAWGKKHEGVKSDTIEGELYQQDHSK